MRSFILLAKNGECIVIDILCNRRRTEDELGICFMLWLRLLLPLFLILKSFWSFEYDFFKNVPHTNSYFKTITIPFDVWVEIRRILVEGTLVLARTTMEIAVTY